MPLMKQSLVKLQFAKDLGKLCGFHLPPEMTDGCCLIYRAVSAYHDIELY
jgi:hypothetical protein